MNRSFASLGMISSIVLLAACNSAPHSTSPLSPDAPQSQSVVYDPSVNWSATELGKVTVTNPSKSVPLTLTFALWNYSSDEVQTVLASAVYTIAPGATAVLTVGATLSCGLTIQRDLYVGKFTGKFTLNEVNSYLYAASGRLEHTQACDYVPPPIVPPVVVDPCVKKLGVSNWHPPVPPPCIVDPCEVKKGQFNNNPPPPLPCIPVDTEGI